MLSGVTAALVGIVDFVSIPHVRQRTLVLSLISLILQWGDSAAAIVTLGLGRSLVVSMSFGRY
ncbi:MAG: hypothetical protein WBG38_01895 [Nodosilinea sp.]